MTPGLTDTRETPIRSGPSSVSFVVACFNEAPVIEQTIGRLIGVAAGLAESACEMIFVDDGSTDGTRDCLCRWAQLDPRVRVVALARNFGHQIAVTAGIDAASGDVLVVIDADLQDPPEVVPAMIAKWREGYDVVYGQRLSRAGESPFKVWSAKLFYWLLNRLSDTPIPRDTADFRLIGRNVADAIRAMPERDRFLRGMVSWVGFKQVAFPYQRAERPAGVSKYSIRKMIHFAADGILSFSSKPLRVSTTLGTLSAGIALVGILYALVLRVFTNIWVEGWTALIIAVLFLGGVQLICVGIVGEYIARIYDEVKKRPLYVTSERIGFPATDANRGKNAPPLN